VALAGRPGALPLVGRIVRRHRQLIMARDAPVSSRVREQLREALRVARRRRLVLVAEVDERGDVEAPEPIGPAAEVFVGTSGWAYPSWKPGFYPAGTASGDFLR
jgi:hypothetical protein